MLNGSLTECALVIFAFSRLGDLVEIQHGGEHLGHRAAGNPLGTPSWERWEHFHGKPKEGKPLHHSSTCINQGNY